MWRISVVFILLACLFSVIIARLFYWQVVAGDSLRSEAFEQYYAKLMLPAARGEIRANDGSPLAMSQSAYLVYAKPKDIPDSETFAGAIATTLDVDAEDLVSRLNEQGRMWVPIAHKVEARIVNDLKALTLPGLGFEKDPRRYYPEASMAAHLLGFVGSDESGGDMGYFGLEGYYDRELRGKDGALTSEKDVTGAPILFADSVRIDAEDGRTITLSLDRTIQQIVEKRLKEGMDRYGAKEGSVVILEPATGAVMAMASYPSYDPSHYSGFDSALYKNPIVAGSYEPGSTFKVIVMSSALEEKLVTPSTTVNEDGPVRIGQYSIRTWNNQYHGTLSMSKVLELSSNVGMVSVGRKLGIDRFLTHIRLFGFGQSTGIDLEDETTPTLRPDNEWKDIDLATASFGQGIAVTPIQMVRAVAVLANGGWLMEPHVVRDIQDSDARVINVPPKRIRRVVSESTARIITEMMVAAVDSGEAKWAKPKGYRIAGKTGTAQIPVAGHYDERKTIASFIGFAPADDPKFVMLVTMREPTSSPWGSETAAPLFFTIAKDLFTYLNIPPKD